MQMRSMLRAEKLTNMKHSYTVSAAGRNCPRRAGNENMNKRRTEGDDDVTPLFAYFDTSAGPYGSQQRSAGAIRLSRCSLQHELSAGQNNSAPCGRGGHLAAISNVYRHVEPSINTNENTTTNTIDGWPARAPSGQHWPSAVLIPQQKQIGRGQNPPHARRAAQPAHCVIVNGWNRGQSALERSSPEEMALRHFNVAGRGNRPLYNNRTYQEVHTWTIMNKNTTTRKRRRRRR